MKRKKGILIYAVQDEERSRICELLDNAENRVFDTGDPLKALDIVNKENIGLVLTNKELTGMSMEDFKRLIEKIKPGVNVLSMSSFSASDEAFSVDIKDFCKLISEHAGNEASMIGEVSDLKTFAFSLADRLLQVLEVNDRYFFNNDHLVAELSGKIAEKMGLEEDLVQAVRMGALLRDLGRIAIHQQILEEGKRLTKTELAPMKTHPLHTVQILGRVPFPWSLDPIIGQHHEHYDGSGYPLGLKGREISIGARIIGVVDAYYAMITDRPYRKALSAESAIHEIRANAGKQFDPEITEVFLSLLDGETTEPDRKKSVIIFERDTDIAAMIKLSTTAEEMEVVHVTKSQDVMYAIRKERPQLIIADMEALEPAAFMKFYRAAAQSAEAAGSRFLLIARDKQQLKPFKRKVDYLIKPFRVDQLSEKIRCIVFEEHSSVPEESRGLTGDLEDFVLTDIIQILSLGMKTAKIEIERGEEKGTLYMLKGRIVYAGAAELRGRDAVVEMMGWEEGTFSIRHGRTQSEVNVTTDTMHLLLEAATVMDARAAGPVSYAPDILL